MSAQTLQKSIFRFLLGQKQGRHMKTILLAKYFTAAGIFYALFTSNSFAQIDPTKKIAYAMQGEPPQLNSTLATDEESFFVLGHLMEGLTRYGAGGDPVPGVAEKWKIDAKGATFYLRKNAKWADGKPVRAQDFTFAWKTALDPKNASEYAFIFYPIKNAEAINKGKMPATSLGVVAKDDHTLEITFEKPCGYFLSLTAFAVYSPVREDFYSAHAGRYGADAKDLLSNGPYVLTQWVHGASLKMERNPHYWNKSLGDLDVIEIPYITPDNSARFNFFKDGKTDILAQLGKDDLPKAQKEGYRMKSFSDGSVFFLEFNFREGRITRNKNLRKAIQAVLNLGEFIPKIISIPGTLPAYSLVPSWVKGVKTTFRKEYPTTPYKADLAQAKKYLEAAKKELGVTQIPPLAWLTGDTPATAREAEYFQNLFKTTLGIELRIDRQIFKQRLAKMTAGDFDIVSAGWGPDYPDPQTFIDLKASWNENNRGKYNNPEYDKLVREAMNTADTKKRMDLMAKAEAIGLEDVAVLPTYERVKVYIHRDGYKNIIRHAIGPDPDFTMVKLGK